MSPEIEVLRRVDFDWTLHLDSVWEDSAYHVPALHRQLRDDLTDNLERGASSAHSPLGRVVVGPAGAGKTHLLAALRREVVARGQWFVLIDMTDVRDFWDTATLGYLSSLLRPLPDGRLQYQAVLARLLSGVLTEADPDRTVRALARAPAGRLAEFSERLLSELRRRNPHEAREIAQQQDVVRALLLLGAEDPTLSDHGYCWLQGLDLDDEVRQRHHFRAGRRHPTEIVRGLAWIMSRSAPTLVAIDQLDAIVSQHHLASGEGSAPATPEQRASLAIIEGLSAGLMALRDLTRRTLTVIACLESTWDVLRRRTLQSSTDRFRPPDTLKSVTREEVAGEIVERRLAPAFAAAGYSPPYPTWPFHPQAFVGVTTATPRHLLKLCDQHRRACVAAGRATEVRSFEDLAVPSAEPAAVELTDLDRRLEQLRGAAHIPEILAEQHEDEVLCALLQTACRCLLRENDYGEEVDAMVDEDFPGAKGYRPLHARIRWVERRHGDRERHLCVRALQRSHPIAYQTRLKAAVTASGIDRSLGFRRLVIVRRGPTPTGPVSRRLTADLLARGGRVIEPTDGDLRTLWALGEIERARPPGLEPWLRRRRPVSATALAARAGLLEAAWVAASSSRGPPATAPTARPATSRAAPTVPPPAPAQAEAPGAQQPPAELVPRLPLGRRLASGEPREWVTVDLPLLARHTVILAGAGSGKTVLARRMIEEAALLGIPSIVIDTASDLVRLGEPWPEAPASWAEGDSARAEAYLGRAEVVVWTPGRGAANPLHLSPLPDFGDVREDPDELRDALDMARETLEPLLAAGTSARAQKKRGILAAALRHLAERGEGRLTDLVALLSDLPAEASAGIGDAERMASELADQLRAALETDVLLGDEGIALDPARLLTARGPGKTRVSVVSLTGLSSLTAQQGFVNRLAMALFGWLRRHPAPAHAPLQGLLLIDEARDFIPAGQGVACRSSLLRLAAQARKYGLGLIFATQTPRSIDHNVIANCTIQVFGRANSPAAIEVVREQLRLRGGGGNDVARLPAGTFYVHSEGFDRPVRTLAPMCLSHHPATPLEAEEVLRRAYVSRAIA